MTEPTITPIEGKVFGAVVTDVDLAHLDDDTFAVIKAAFLDRGFLVFPDQHLSVEQNIAFGERFGELEFGGAPMANQRKNGEGAMGDVYDVDTQIMRTNIGNETWHTDSTYKPISSKCAMLSAVTVPDEGGETELADMRAGYAALPEATRDRIAGLSAYHSTQFSQANDLGDFPEADLEGGRYGSVYHGEAYLRPLVKIHPETGVPNLFVGRHAFGIPGMARPESRDLLKSLVDFVTVDPSRVYTHRWSPGDTMIWDNRALLHRARPYDYAEPRYLIGTRVAGDEATELAYWPSDPEAAAGREALAAELEILRTETSHLRYGATTASD